MEGQLQTWISLQIKESLWGPNPVRHSLGRPYKGSTLNPLRVQLNEITPAMCDTLWFFISFSLSLHLQKKKAMGGGLIVTPLGINPNMESVLYFSLFLSLALSLPAFFFLSFRWEAFRVLPLAESLTNVALKCNEVWNGSCGYNYPRTGAVTGMISLSLAIRIGNEWERARKRERWRDWVTVSDPAELYMCVEAGKQTRGVFMEG